MKLSNLLRFSTAAHYSYMVECAFPQRGGILLVAGPGNMKSTIVKETLRHFPNALVYSDLTLKQLAVIRSQIANGVYHTLGFLELEKVYARNLSVAMNFEGVIKAMVEEGFAHFAFEDQRCWVPTARCFVFASVLDNLYRFHFPRWQDNGFLRRFIVFKYQLSREAKAKIKAAIHEGDLVSMPGAIVLPSAVLKMDVTKEESIQLEHILGSDEFTPLNLLRRCFVIMKWMHKQEKNRKKLPTPMECLQDLQDGIGPTGGELDLV